MRIERVVIFVGMTAHVATTSSCSTPYAAVDAEPADAGATEAAAVDASIDASIDAAAMTAAAYRATVFADRPIAYFAFDDENHVAGTGIRDDVSGGVIGVVRGTPAFQVPGAVAGGTAIQFLSGDWIELGDRYGFPGTSPFTIEVWVKPEGTELGHIFTKEQREAPGEGYALVNYSPVFFDRFVAGNKSSVPGGPIDTMSFHHVVVTYDGGFVSMYVDGVSNFGVGDSRPLVSHTAPAIVGAAGTDGSFPLVGSLDNLAIYDTALQPERVAAHYDAARMTQPTSK